MQNLIEHVVGGQGILIDLVGLNSADGGLVMLPIGMSSRPKDSLMYRANSYTMVFGTSLMTASPPHMSP